VYGQWWKPDQILALARTKGEKSAYAGVVRHINYQLAKFDSSDSLEKRAVAKPESNIPPPCKESRRLFVFVYDHLKKGGLNQPAVVILAPTSIGKWDKFRQDLSLMKIYVDREPKPVTLIGTIITMSLETRQIGQKTFSMFEFAYDRISAPQVRQLLLQTRADYSEEVMKFQIKMGDFDTTTAQDPTSLLSDVEGAAKSVDDVDLPATVDLDDTGDILPKV